MRTRTVTALRPGPGFQGPLRGQRRTDGRASLGEDEVLSVTLRAEHATALRLSRLSDECGRASRASAS